MKTIVGLFDTYAHAQNVVKDLVDAGVPRSEISLLANDREGKYSQSAGTGESTGVDDQRTADGTTVGENVAGGALLGGIGGLLIGLGALAIPGIGPVIAAGPLATTLAGAGFGALGGGLIGAIKDMGVPDEDAHVYAEGVRRGGTLVSVHVDEDMTDSVTDILNRHDAIDVDERSGEYKTAGWSNFSHEATPYAGYEEDTQRRSGSVAGTATSVAGSPYAPGTTSGALDTGTTNAAAMGTGGYGATGSSLGVGSRSEETRARRRARVYPRS